MENINQGNNQLQNGDNSGTDNQKNWNYDPVTGKPYNGSTTYQNGGPKQDQNQNNMANSNQEGAGEEGATLFLISLCSFIIGNVMLFSGALIYSGILLIIGFLCAIVASEKTPQRTYAKLLLALYFLEVIIIVIALAIQIYSCLTCEGCEEMS